MKSMSQLAVLTRRWSPATMKLGPFQEVILESSSVEELKEKVCVCLLVHVMDKFMETYGKLKLKFATCIFIAAQ